MQVAQVCFLSGFECVQRCKHHRCSGQPAQVFDCFFLVFIWIFFQVVFSGHQSLSPTSLFSSIVICKHCQHLHPPSQPLNFLLSKMNSLSFVRLSSYGRFLSPLIIFVVLHWTFSSTSLSLFCWRA